jgi:hypothetical protein
MWSPSFWTIWKFHEDTPKLVPDEPSEAKLPTADKLAEDVTEKVGEITDEWRLKKRVLCMPGRDLLGEAFALIIAQLVSRDGIGVRAEHPDALRYPGYLASIPRT